MALVWLNRCPPQVPLIGAVTGKPSLGDTHTPVLGKWLSNITFAHANVLEIA